MLGHDVTIGPDTILALYTPGRGDPTTRSVLLCRLPHPSDTKPRPEEAPQPAEEVNHWVPNKRVPNLPLANLFAPLGEEQDYAMPNSAPLPTAESPMKLELPEPEQYVMIDHLQLALCISVPPGLQLELLCRFMLNSYCFVHYSAEKAQEAADQYTTCADEHQASPLLLQIERQNQEDYAAYQAGQRRAKWDEQYSPDDDEALQDMPNVRFLRDVRPFQARGPEFKQERQYRLLFDNHRVLLHFVRRFRKPVEREGVLYQVRVMDPILNSNALWSHAEAPEHYVERQLNSRENPSFAHALHFEQSQTLRHGLLWPGLFPLNYANALQDNTAERMRDASRLDLSFAGKYKAQLAYNKFLIDVAREEMILHRVDYAQRRARLGYTEATMGTKKAKKATTAADAKDNKRKPDQASLEQFFARKTVKLNC